LDRHSIDEYSTFDPLSKNSLSLDELKAKADNSSRKYPNANKEEGSRDNRRNEGGDRNRRDDRRDDRGGGGGRSNQTSWKNDRMQGA
jgi:hypothetical protein